MKIAKVECQNNRGGLLFPDLESVWSALDLYVNLEGTDALAVGPQFARDFGMAGVALLQMTGPTSQSVMDEFMAKMRADLTRQLELGLTYASVSYEYEGRGPFMKGNVSVMPHGDGQFILHINDGFHAMKGLAEQLNLVLGMNRSNVDVWLDAHRADRTVVNLDMIMRKLGSTNPATDGASLAKILEEDRHHYDGTRPKIKKFPGLSEEIFDGVSVNLIGLDHYTTKVVGSRLTSARSRDHNALLSLEFRLVEGYTFDPERIKLLENVGLHYAKLLSA